MMRVKTIYNRMFLRLMINVTKTLQINIIMSE